MKNTANKSKVEILRQKAEELLKKKPSKSGLQLAEVETLKLIHELQVHQIELELQNEELMLAISDAENAAEKYTELYDFAPSGYFTLSKIGEIIELNIRGAKMLNQERKHLKNRRFVFFVSEDTKPKFNLFLEKVFNSNYEEICEVMLSTNGNLPIFVYISGIATENGEQCLITVIDISMRKQEEEKVRLAHARLRRFIDLNIVGVIIATANGKIIETNDYYLNLIGYSREEFEGEKIDWNAITTPEWLPTDENAIREMREKGTCTPYEKEYLCRNGTRIAVLITGAMLPGPEEQIAGFILNITERKRAEEALHKSEEKFRRIIESSTNGMYFYHIEENDRLIFIGANPAADRIIGISHQTIFGKTIEEAFPNLAATGIPAMYKSIAKGEIGSQEFDMEYKDEAVSGFYHIQAFQTEKDTITVNFTEISERKNAEKLIEKQTAELQELNVTKDKFLSIIAHDLKNPFNAILGFSDLMLKNFYHLDDETLMKGLTTIESAASLAYKLLENLLIWSQNQTERSTFKPESLNLIMQVNESLSMIQSAATKKGIRVVVSIKKSIQIFADKNMIDSILRNLISNAIKFSHKGSKIRIAATETNHEIHISVTDNGVGMSFEKLSSIFRIDKHTITLGTNNEQGTGLGLILCKDFVTRHNGNIWVESTPEKGSTFTFSLPLN